MNRLTVRLVLAALAITPFAACGGKLDVGDAGPGNADASTNPPPSTSTSPTTSTSGNPPPSPTCSPIEVSSPLGGVDTCEVDAKWMCSATTYSVTCSCIDGNKSGSCSCTAETTNMGNVAMIDFDCSQSCSVNGPTLASLCGFPH